MSEEQAKTQLAKVEEAEQGYEGLYNIVKEVFDDAEEADWFLQLTTFFSSLLRMALMQSDAIAQQRITEVVAPLVGAPQQSEGGIVLPDGVRR